MELKLNNESRVINFRKMSFIKSATKEADYLPSDLPEIALLGRSNVGKSTLINAISENKKLARVSNTPGKTITINFYNVDGHLRIVDLPGYGYAERSFLIKKDWENMIETYINTRNTLKGLFHLVDIRHLTENDLIMRDWIKKSGIACVLVVTKCDKLGQIALSLRVKELSESFSLNNSLIAISKGSELSKVKKEILNVLDY